MTNDKNDSNNWVVAMMEWGDEGEVMRVLHTDQAENIARQKAEKAALDYPNQSIFVYQRVATVRTEPVARWL